MSTVSLLYGVSVHFVGLYAEEDGLYAGEDGLYAGEDGLYTGEDGLYTGEDAAPPILCTYNIKQTTQIKINAIYRQLSLHF